MEQGQQFLVGFKEIQGNSDDRDINRRERVKECKREMPKGYKRGNSI